MDLACGLEDDGDVALHLNPRCALGVTVLNSRQRGEWGPEQRRDLPPLAPGAPFELVISVTPHGYQVWGGGERGQGVVWARGGGVRVGPKGSPGWVWGLQGGGGCTQGGSSRWVWERQGGVGAHTRV